MHESAPGPGERLMSQEATKKASQVASGMMREQIGLRMLILAPICASPARP